MSVAGKSGTTLMRQSMSQRLRAYLDYATDIEEFVSSRAQVSPRVEGKLIRVVGLTLEAVGCVVSLGDRCCVTDNRGRSLEAEVVGFDNDKVFLMPLDSVAGLQPGARVVPVQSKESVPLGNELLGRVINGLGEPIDGRGALLCKRSGTLQSSPLNPMERKRIDSSLDVGISCINSLFTVGRGQRLGLFAGSGVGKSVLLGMMTRFTEADVIVVGLIGERGREVREFIEEVLGSEGRRRAVVVAAPADESPLLRLRAANVTLRIAEDFRDSGKNVLLLMDSLTRFAMAQREIALAIGEPPATKGYPPSVFALLPKLVERAGNASNGDGSITAFFTVLTEGDDQQDPVADSSRAILDGHIVLSRKLAEEGHYPAIDIESSISRVMPAIVSPEYLEQATEFRKLYSCFEQNRDLISVGAYIVGSDKDIDRAIERRPYQSEFLQQSLQASVSIEQAQGQLMALMHSGVSAAKSASRTPASATVTVP